MSAEDSTGGAARRQRVQAEAERRRRLEEVFGPSTEQTADDLDLEADGGPTGAAGRGGAGRGDTWLREQVPPHHGG